MVFADTLSASTKLAPLLCSKESLHQFIGLINYYHHFIPWYADILQPLHQVLAAEGFTSTMYFWSEVFEEVEQTLSEAVMLVHPQSNQLLASRPRIKPCGWGCS